MCCQLSVILHIVSPINCFLGGQVTLSLLLTPNWLFCVIWYLSSLYIYFTEVSVPLFFRIQDAFLEEGCGRNLGTWFPNFAHPTFFPLLKNSTQKFSRSILMNTEVLPPRNVFRLIFSTLTSLPLWNWPFQNRREIRLNSLTFCCAVGCGNADTHTKRHFGFWIVWRSSSRNY